MKLIWGERERERERERKRLAVKETAREAERASRTEPVSARRCGPGLVERQRAPRRGETARRRADWLEPAEGWSRCFSNRKTPGVTGDLARTRRLKRGSAATSDAPRPGPR